MVPTVERGFFDVDFWSIETAGERPSMKSTSGLSIWPRNCRAYAESDSTERRCPSAKMVSKASDDLPEPDSPVKTMSESRGRSIETSLRLCSRAPRMISWSATALPRDCSNTCSPSYAGGQLLVPVHGWREPRSHGPPTVLVSTTLAPARGARRGCPHAPPGPPGAGAGRDPRAAPGGGAAADPLRGRPARGGLD